MASTTALRRHLVLIVIVLLLGMISHGNYAGSGDAVHYLVTAHSVAFDRDLDVSNNYSDPSTIINETGGAHAVPGRGGILRPVHDVGLPVLAAPYFGIAYRIAQMTDRLPESFRRRAKLDDFIALRHLMSIFVILITAALAIVFFETSSRLTGLRTPAFFWTIVWTLSPPILSHSYVFFTEIPSAFLALCAYRMLDGLDRNRPFRAGAILGILVGLLVLIHVRNVGLAIGFLILVIARVRSAPARSVGFVVAVALMASLKMALNFHMWGHPITSPHAHLGEWTGLGTLLAEVGTRVTGLLFDARHGLLFSAPVYLLAPAAWLMLRRKSLAASNELVVLVAAYVAFIAVPMTNAHGWQGGWSPAARFLVPIAPFLALAVPLLSTSERATRIAMGIVVVQVLLNGLFWQEPKLLWTEGPGHAPFLERIVGPSLARRVPYWEE